MHEKVKINFIDFWGISDAWSSRCVVNKHMYRAKSKADKVQRQDKQWKQVNVVQTD